MPEAHLDHARAIGAKLRAARQTRGLSLRALASKAEISAGMLSQIETGKSFPSVRSIYSIAAALGVPVDYFFPDHAPGQPDSPPDGNQPTNHTLTAREMRQARADSPPPDAPADAHSDAALIRPVDRPTIELKGGVTWTRLTVAAEENVEFLEVTYAPGASSGAEMSHHAGREFGLVLEGELSLKLGLESYNLKAGDSIVFDSSTPHRLSNKGAEFVRAIWVVLGTA